jgi:hypothetical protein
MHVSLSFCNRRIPMKYVAPVSLTVVALLAFALSGCGSNSTEPTGSSDSSSGTRAENDSHGDHNHGDHAEHSESGQTDMEKMKAELARWSPEDAASAEKQHMCPVSGEMLGTMGAPEKVDVNGQQVWICCDGCKDQLLEKPDEYLAKLSKE